MLGSKGGQKEANDLGSKFSFSGPIRLVSFWSLTIQGTCYFETQMRVCQTRSTQHLFLLVPLLTNLKRVPSNTTPRQWSPDHQPQEGGWLIVAYAPCVEDRDVSRKGFGFVMFNGEASNEPTLGLGVSRRWV